LIFDNFNLQPPQVELGATCDSSKTVASQKNLKKKLSLVCHDLVARGSISPPRARGGGGSKE